MQTTTNVIYRDTFQFKTNSETESKIIETDEYIQIPFIMLSANLITDYWIDFRKENVLLEAVEMFATKLYTDHKTDVRNSIGVALNPRYITNPVGQTLQTIGGQTLQTIGGQTFLSDNTPNTPDHILADYRIFKNIAPEIVERLKTKPPILDSTSVGISFEFEKSHPMKQYEFITNLGREIDGHNVRMIVTKITDIHEASLVSNGADRNAKRILTTQHKDVLRHVPTTKEQTMIKLTTELAQKLGYTAETEITTERAVQHLENLTAQNENIKTELKECANIIEVKTTDEKLIWNEIKVQLEIPSKLRKNAIEECQKYYNQLTEGKPDPIVVEMIQNSSLKQAESLSKTYHTALTLKYKPTQVETKPNAQTLDASEYI